jgi:hypothetical protein
LTSTEELIKIQKSFIISYINNQIKDLFNRMNEKIEFKCEEIFQLIKLIIKDNFEFTLNFKFNLVIMEIAIENTFYFSLKEILQLYRKAYNEEIKIFSSKNYISIKKNIFIMDQIIKLLFITEKYYKILNDGMTDPKFKDFKDFITKNTLAITTEINEMGNNYNLMIVKDLKTNGIYELINLYKYENLINLEEEKINDTTLIIRAQIKKLFSDLDEVKVGIETENYFFNFFIQTFISKLIEECEKSIKKIPKNKYLISLTDKTLKLIEELTSRFTINQKTSNSIDKSIKILKNYFSSLNMNKI